MLAAVTDEAECWRVSRLAVISSHLILSSTGLRCLPFRVFIVKSSVVVLCVSIIRSASMPLVEGSCSQTYAQIVVMLRQSIG